MMGGTRVIQFCHGYDAPFLDCARQYAVLFRDTPYKVTTVYLTGKPNDEVVRGSASDEVIFLDFSSKQIRGLKLGAIKRFREIIAQRDVRFIIAHRSKPTYVALLATRLPVISIHHAFDDYKRMSRRLFANIFQKRLFLLGVSNAVRDDLRASLTGWPSGHIDTLYNRIDVETLQAEQIPRATARERLGLPQAAWIVGNVGRLHPDKDQATLIRGFAQVLAKLPAGSLLAIMGAGPLETSLKDLARELGVAESVRFLGKVGDGRRYFKAFDVFALTSDHEPFGMVLLEAMAAGVPLICSDCGGGREVVADIGYLFPLGDVAALSQTLQDASVKGFPVASDICRGRLHRFSDDAAKQHFWSLSFIKNITS